MRKFESTYFDGSHTFFLSSQSVAKMINHRLEVGLIQCGSGIYLMMHFHGYLKPSNEIGFFYVGFVAVVGLGLIQSCVELEAMK